jgi:hypothetical protein
VIAMTTAAELRARAADARAARITAEAEERELTAAAQKAEYEERRAKEAAENAAHYQRMYDEIGQPLAGLNEAQHGIVYAQAWEQGHAYGYSEVESHYGDFAEMARKLIEAN